MLAAVFEAQHAIMVAYAYRSVWDADAAATLVGDAYMRACQALARGDVVEHPVGWLWQILKRLLIDEVRVRQRRAGLLCALDDGVDEYVGSDGGLAGVPAALDAQAVVWPALARLPERQRLAVVMRYWQGMDYVDIGARLGGLNRNGAKQLVTRAREKLRKEIAWAGVNG